MQKVGSVTETADQNAEFTNGNVAQGVPPTILESAIFNTWQREMCNVVEGSGIALDPTDDGQLLKAIIKSVDAGRLVKIRTFTASGTYVPSSGTKYIKVTVTGGGGGGGECQASDPSQTFAGAGGGAGGTAIKVFSVLSSSYNIIVGSGGAENTKGGDSSFADMLGKGGLGAGYATSTSTPGGAGGNATGGDINIFGAGGQDGQSDTYFIGGCGGSSFYGGGSRSGSKGGIDATVYGTGGGGSYDTSFSGLKYKGGNGMSGIVIIEEF